MIEATFCQPKNYFAKIVKCKRRISPFLHRSLELVVAALRELVRLEKREVNVDEQGLGFDVDELHKSCTQRTC